MINMKAQVLALKRARVTKLASYSSTSPRPIMIMSAAQLQARRRSISCGRLVQLLQLTSEAALTITRRVPWLTSARTISMQGKCVHVRPLIRLCSVALLSPFSPTGFSRRHPVR